MGYIISGGSVNIDNNTIKKNAEGELYVNANSPLTTTSGLGLPIDNTTIALNSSNAIAVKPSTITQNSTLSNITISSNTTLTSDVYCNNFTINSGITLTTNGYNIYCAGTFTNNGTINTGNVNNGGSSTSTNGDAGGSFPNSYGGSGGGGGGGVNYTGGNGGNTLISGGSGGASTTAGGNGSTPSAPTLSNSLIQSWYNNGISNYLSGGGGGGGGGPSGASGGGGAFGLYIQANQITAGTINATGGGGGNAPEGGGGGSGGGGVILLAYGSGGYKAGAYNVNSGYGGGGVGVGGGGGNGQILTYSYTIAPILTSFTYTTSANPLKNRNSSYLYIVNNTTSTSPTTIISQSITPQTTGLIAVRVVAKVYNNTIGDGVFVGLYNGSTLLDSDSYTQEGTANNPHYIILYYEGLYSVGTQQTFSVQFNAITGGTAYCEIQEFTIEEVY